MEPFLSTLPPYVHEFLNRHPPTDVFNVLRELICFAVLYSNDREKILNMSKNLMAKGATDGVDKSLSMGRSTTAMTTAAASFTTAPEPVASVSERILPAAVRQEYEAAAAAAAAKPPPAAITAEPTPVSSASSSVRSATDTPPPTKPGVPYTFPEWWGHHDEPEPINAKKSEEKQVKAARRETVSTWVPWDEPTTSADKKMQRTMSVASSKPIPDLRPYLERSHTVTGSSQKSTPRRSATNSPANTTPRSSKTPTLPARTTPTSARSSKTPAARASMPPATRATITPTTTTRASKTPSTASSSPSSASPPLSRTQSAFRPGLTATVRARQEHAKAKERELEEQKLKAAQLNGVNTRLKQQAKSTIDWAAIKQERRRTMPIMKPSSS